MDCSKRGKLAAVKFLVQASLKTTSELTTEMRVGKSAESALKILSDSAAAAL